LALEKALSSPGSRRRYELLSSWRLARDESYAPWAAEIGTACCQITFCGLEAGTTGSCAAGALSGISSPPPERLIGAGIAPRWQLFLTKRILDDLEPFARLVRELDLPRRCAGIGPGFELFIGGISPEGCGFALEPWRVDEGDPDRIRKACLRCAGTGRAGSACPNTGCCRSFYPPTRRRT
jgi:hypothetical protein